MKESTFRFTSEDGVEVFVYHWQPDRAPRAAVQIAHGMGEHAARYARVAEALCGAGHVVYANDHRGHGRTARCPDELGHFGLDGWNRLVGDVGHLAGLVQDAHPGTPLVLLGHSMGSFAVQQLMIECGERFEGVVLSGSTSVEPSPEPRRISFEALNLPFEPARTPFDWLSRDPDEVDRYLADPLCGFTVSEQAARDLFAAARRLADPAELARIPRGLPVLLLAGDRDPVNEDLTGVERLIERYRRAGLTSLSWKFYPGGRHEMLNETNRDEVTRDLLAWIEEVVSRP